VSRYKKSSLPPLKSFAADGRLICDGADYVARAHREIARWERSRRGAIGKLTDFVLGPAGVFTERMVPPWLKTSAAVVIEKSLRLAAYASALSVDENAVVLERNRLISRKKGVAESLRLRDDLAKKHWVNHCKYAAAEGAAAGLTGIIGFVADVPLVISLAIREVRLIGLCFGYHVNTPAEVDYILHVLRIGSSVDPKSKASSLDALKKIEAHQRRQACGPRKQSCSGEQLRFRYLVSLEEYSRLLSLQLIRRGVLHFVPFAAAITGASFNAAYAHDVGRAAYMSYRRRFLADRSTS
jgi:EcsC protein family